MAMNIGIQIENNEIPTEMTFSPVARKLFPRPPVNLLDPNHNNDVPACMVPATPPPATKPSPHCKTGSLI